MVEPERRLCARRQSFGAKRRFDWLAVGGRVIAKRLHSKRDVCSARSAEALLTRCEHLILQINHNSHLTFPPIPPQTTVEVEFSPDDSVASYDLCYKIYQQTWEQQKVKAIGKDLLKGGNVQVAIEELEPGTTYCFRLVAKDADGTKGEPGPELIIDTEAISCTPKTRRCVIL